MSGVNRRNLPCVMYSLFTADRQPPVPRPNGVSRSRNAAQCLCHEFISCVVVIRSWSERSRICDARKEFVERVNVRRYNLSTSASSSPYIIIIILVARLLLKLGRGLLSPPVHGLFRKVSSPLAVMVDCLLLFPPASLARLGNDGIYMLSR